MLCRNGPVYARIVGADLFWDMSSDEIHRQIDKYAAQDVSVMLVWTKISDEDYLWTKIDSLHLTDIANYTHAPNYPDMKIVVYVAPMEQQTTDVDLDENGVVDPGKTSVYTMHPEWLQVGINGNPAVFYGSVAFWLDSTSEDVWLCPNDPVYKQIWINNLYKLAQTGIDGVWWDVPFFIHYFGDDWDGEWTCHCSDCQTEFSVFSGYSIPSEENWDDPAWLKFINWRYSVMGNFIKECGDSAKKVNPDFVVFNESWNPVNVFESQVGFDPDIARINNYNDGVVHEFNPINPDQYHYYSWLLDAAIGIIYRGIDQDRASWVLNYSDNSEHAKTRCANILFSGCNFYEVNYPMMSSTVGLTLRTSLFNWIKYSSCFYYDTNLKPFFKTAVLYSPCSFAYYGSESEEYSEELKGIAMMLLESHIPFEILPDDLLDNLSEYDNLILPNVTALSQSNIEKIKAFIQNGGKLVSTGLTSFLNEDGSTRSTLGLIDVFGTEPKFDSFYKNSFGSGTCVSTKSYLGSEYFHAGNPIDVETQSRPSTAENKRISFINNLWKPLNNEPIITTNAPKEIVFNTFTKGDSLIVRVINFSGLKWHKNEPDSQTGVHLTIEIPEKWSVESAFQIDFLGDKSDLEFTNSDQQHISCTFNISRHKILGFIKTVASSVEGTKQILNSLAIGPNPVHNTLKIYFNRGEIRSYRIYNSIGRLVAKGENPFAYINTANLANGIYFLQIKTASKIYIRKFVVLKN